VKPRAVTGLGIVSTLGIGREAFLRAMKAPPLLTDVAPEPIESFDAKAYPEAAVAEVKGFDPAKYLGDKGLRTLDRLTKLLIVSARLAMHDAGFKKDGVFVSSNADRVGICCSNAYGSLEAITELNRVAKLEDARYINPAKFPNTVSNSASGYASIWEDLRALNVAVSDGNCGALDAVACADIYLETGRADALLVGGAEAMSEAIFLAFRRLGALAVGTRLGEGAVLLAIEPTPLAKARGARTLAEVFGYGTAFIPPEHEASLVHASPEAMERAILAAIADAEVEPGDVDLVASGVSGLPAFDQAETGAIERVFGADVAIAAPKAILGETLGAGGGMAMAAALAWLGGATPSTVIRGKPKGRVRTVVVTSMGFYGNASAVVMRHETQQAS
jgi:3-oxoacyl-[acyl-carrier-protein] synthase II